METSAVGTDLSMMLSQLLDGAAIHELHRLSGGASRETWRFEADGRPLILQRQRAGDDRDMLIEAGVVRAAGAGGAPVPALLDARRRDDGMAFMVLEAIEGETIARKIQRDPEFERARPRLVADLAPPWQRFTLSIPKRRQVLSRLTRFSTTPACSMTSANLTRFSSLCAIG